MSLEGVLYHSSAPARGKAEFHVREIWCTFFTHGFHQRVLDAGCGTGWLGKYKPNPPVEVFGIDLNLEKLKEARKHETVVRGDVRSLPFTDGFFDGILAFHITEHVSENLALMREFNRVLRIWGILIAESPSPWCGQFWDDYTHVRPYTRKSFEKLTEDAGFEVLMCRYLGGMPMPLLGRLGLSSFAAKLRVLLANHLCKWGKGNVFLVAKKLKDV